MSTYNYNLKKKNRVPALDRACIILLALCPILQHYKGLYVNAAVSVLLVVTPYTLIKLYKRRFIKFKDILFVAPLVIYFFYKVADHGTSINESGQAVIFSILVISISAGCFNTKYFIKVITVISIIACVSIIIQYLCYYILHFHVQLVPTSLLLDKSSQWVLGAKTGRGSITGRIIKFYRPSAFFLEPSHMFIYMFTPLVLEILSVDFGKRERNIAILLSVGMVLSTSGMGIITAIGIWFVYFGKRGKGFSLARFLQPKTIFLMFLLLIVVVVMYINVPFFQNSVVRIFGSGYDYKNAISGRVSSGNNLIRQIRGIQLLIGVEDRLTGIEFNMSGFNATMYQFGIIGVILSYIFYLQGIFILKGLYFWLSLVIIALSFFSAHTHSTMFMIYATFVYTDGYREMYAKKKLSAQNLSQTNQKSLKILPL